jgi:hypothetical protein
MDGSGGSMNARNWWGAEFIKEVSGVFLSITMGSKELLNNIVHHCDHIECERHKSFGAEQHLLNYNYKSTNLHHAVKVDLSRYGCKYVESQPNYGNIECVYCSYIIRNHNPNRLLGIEHFLKNPKCLFLLDHCCNILSHEADSGMCKELEPYDYDEYWIPMPYEAGYADDICFKDRRCVMKHDGDAYFLYDKNMRREIVRLKTFPREFPASTDDFARYGFRFKGNLPHDDRVQCVFCNLEITDITKNDHALILHIKGNPDCPLLESLSVGRDYNIPIHHFFEDDLLEMRSKSRITRDDDPYKEHSTDSKMYC